MLVPQQPPQEVTSGHEFCLCVIVAFFIILFLLLTLVGSFASFIDTERTMDRLSGELDRARARIGILEAEASRQRERYRALGMKRKEAVREAKRLESELRDLLVLREAENERTHRGILELVDEAVAAATADATASIKYRVLEAKKLQEKTRREHSARVKELERQLSLAHVNQQRIECSVAEMLKETAEEVSLS